MKRTISNRAAGIGAAGVSLAAVLAMTLAMSVTAFADTEVTTETEAQMAVTYQVSPEFTVTIPESVAIEGSSVTVSAENVVLDEGKQVSVKITGTSGDNNAFTVTTDEGTDTLTYTVTDDNDKSYVLDDTILSVDPADASADSVDLTFALADGETAKYSSAYSGTMTFTISVEDTSN